MQRRLAATAATALVTALAPTLAHDYRRVTLVRSDHVEIPFLVDLAPDGAPGQAHILNGEEVLSAPVETTDGLTRIQFPQYDAVVTMNADGTGWYERTVRGGIRSIIEVRSATLEGLYPGARFHTDAAPTQPPGDARSGEQVTRWRVAFADSGPAELVLHTSTQGDAPDGPVEIARATVLTPTGDYRYLDGVIDTRARNARTLRLSVFDGAHAFLLTGRFNAADDTIEGHFYAGATFHETFTATRLKPGDATALPDPLSEATLKPGVTKLHLTALDEPQYRGKAVIIQIFGSWCPNCHDEAPVLADLYHRYHNDGLEILGLAYEHTGDDARSRRQVDRFRERYGITWEIIVAGTSDKSEAAATLPDLTAVKAFPTTIFVQRDGTVRAIHTGFAGPATGEAFEDLKHEFDGLVRECLGPATAPGAR